MVRSRACLTSSRIKRTPTFYSMSVNDSLNALTGSKVTEAWMADKNVVVSTFSYGFRSLQDAILSLKCTPRVFLYMRPSGFISF